MPELRYPLQQSPELGLAVQSTDLARRWHAREPLAELVAQLSIDDKGVLPVGHAPPSLTRSPRVAREASFTWMILFYAASEGSSRRVPTLPSLQQLWMAVTGRLAVIHLAASGLA